MRVIVTFSGGKDSLAALLWTREHITKNFTTVFCDTGWEHPLTYEYIHRIADKLHLDLVTLKSKKYDGMIDLARQKKRWPSTRARFCTIELKTKPTIDYVLDDVQDNMLMIQGIRGAESPARAKMSKQCTYFKYYFEPYGFDKTASRKSIPIEARMSERSGYSSPTIFCVPCSTGRRNRSSITSSPRASNRIPSTKWVISGSAAGRA